MPEAFNFIKKETLAQVFSYKFHEIAKNTFFYRTPSVAASSQTSDRGLKSTPEKLILKDSKADSHGYYF